jgi:hypothetical protein
MSRLARRLLAAAPLLLVLLPAAVISGWIVAGGRPAGWFTDSIFYLMFADFYQAMAGGGSVPPDVAHGYRSSRYPPLFPLLLALFDAGTDHPVRALWVTNATALLAGAVLWLWFRREFADRWLAAAAALAAVLTPAWLLWLLDPVSEPLLVLLPALVGLTPLARMAALPFVGSALLWLWRLPGLPMRVRVLATAAMVAPGLAWTGYRSLATPAESYASAVVGPGSRLELGDPLAWLVHEGWRVIEGVGGLWHLPSAAATAVLALVVLGLAAAGCAARLRRNTLDAAYLPGYLGLVLLWPYPAETERLLIVVIPFLLVFAMEGARLLAARAPARTARAAGAAVPALLLAGAMPMLIQGAGRAAMPLDAELAAYKREPAFLTEPSAAWARVTPEVYLRLQRTIEAVPQVVPVQACVYAPSPYLVRYWGRRIALNYPRGLVDPEQARRELTACSYFLVGSTTTLQFDEPVLYPLDLIAGWTRPVIASYFEFGGERMLAAALLERIPEEPAP